MFKLSMCTELASFGFVDHRTAERMFVLPGLVLNQCMALTCLACAGDLGCQRPLHWLSKPSLWMLPRRRAPSSSSFPLSSVHSVLSVGPIHQNQTAMQMCLMVPHLPLSAAALAMGLIQIKHSTQKQSAPAQRVTGRHNDLTCHRHTLM